MIICLEGPEKAGKTTLAETILLNFDEDKSRIVKQSGRDANDGLGYLHDFIAGLDSNQIDVWDRAWIGEVVYGTLLNEGRKFANDRFMCEWLYGRLLEGRGGKFVVLPTELERLDELRDETDLDVDPDLEYSMFYNYATRWGYEVLWNEYKPQSLVENALTARRSPFVDIHKTDSTEYVGSRNPSTIFVGDSRQEFSFEHRPFFDRVSAEYFRPYGTVAINKFGYCSVAGFEAVQKTDPRLLKAQIITVGSRAHHYYPDYPTVPFDENAPTLENVVAFMEAVATA